MMIDRSSDDYYKTSFVGYKLLREWIIPNKKKKKKKNDDIQTLGNAQRKRNIV